MKTTLYVIASAIVLSSCASDSKKNQNSSYDSVVEVSQDTLKADEALSANNTNHISESNWLQVRFPDLTIAIEKMELGWESMYLSDNDSIYATVSDTAYFDLWPGEWFYDKKFKVEKREYDDIKLYEKIIYNVAMLSSRATEAPLCVLYDWKSLELPWSQIQFMDDVPRFRSNENKKGAAINFTTKEFKTAVKAHCGAEWYDEIKNVNVKDKLQSEIFASQYIFKIVLRNSKTGKTSVKFIVFNPPTSC